MRICGRFLPPRSSAGVPKSPPAKWAWVSTNGRAAMWARRSGTWGMLRARGGGGDGEGGGEQGVARVGVAAVLHERLRVSRANEAAAGFGVTPHCVDVLVHAVVLPQP